jgi:hypothetical protein
MSNLSDADRSHRRTECSGADKLFRLLLINGLWGCAIGFGAVIGVLALDLGQLRTLISGSQEAGLAIALLCGGMVVTFGSVVMGSAIMMIPKDDDEQGGTPSKQIDPSGLVQSGLIPVRVRARS